MATVPLIMTATGLQPQSPSNLLSQLITSVAATNPDYTANLPGTLIEDIASTSIGAVALCDAALVELLNCITPGTANQYILTQLGAQFGITQGVGYNTSVNVVFTGPAGYAINQGFIVSDGSYQYVLQNTVVIPSGGQTGQCYCLAVLAGSIAVVAGTVTQLVSVPPNTISLSVTNPFAGVPGTGAETVQAYQARVVQAGQAISQGMPPTLRTALQAVPGVQARLVSVLQGTNQWEILCGGGDPYSVAGAIFSSLFDISSLIGSTLSVASITQANPGVVTTNLAHGFATGQVIKMTGVLGMTQVNNVNYTITVINATSFSIGVSTTSYGAYTSGGVVTPNLRNVSVSINDYPDTYSITYVTPPQQTVSITATWNTISSNYISPAAISQLAIPALVSYVNSIVVGQPLNVMVLNQTFQSAIASVLPASLLISLVFVIELNGVVVNVESGTQIIPGDPESYFYTSSANISVVQA